MKSTPSFDSAAETEALRKTLQKLPKALWKGAIEAGKTTPLAAFALTFLSELQDACQSLPPEHRQEMALALRRARFEDIETELKVLGCEQREQQKVLAKILQALGAHTAMVDGYAPQREDLLAVVGRLDTLPDEILIPVRTELETLGDKLDAVGRRQESLEGVMEAQPDRIKHAMLDEREKERTRESDEFERQYLKQIREEYGYLDLLGIPNYAQRSLPIDAAFITLSLSGAESSPLPAETLLSKYPCLVIRGDAGAGKTTLMQWQCIRYCDERRRTELGREYAHAKKSEFDRDETRPGPIPFFLKLHKLVKTQGDYPAFPPVNEWVELSTPHLALQPPAGWLQQALERGRVVLMLDGLDELQDTKRPQFWTELQRLLNQYPKLRFRVTSRPFPTEGDKADQWRPPQLPDSDGGTPVVEVQPLTQEKIDLLIGRWHDAAVLAEPTEESRTQARRDLEGYAEALKRKIRESDYRRILDLASTPFLCAAICLINRFRKQLLPKERHNLYRMLIEALISQRDKQREIRVLTKEYDLLTMETLVRVHAHLALEMMTSGELRREDEDDRESPDSAVLIEAKKTEARKWLKDCIDTIPTLYGKTDAANLLDYMIVRCGLLREPAAGKLDFRHRALQEYLAGTGAVQSTRIGLLVNNAHDDRWRDTIILAAGGYNVGNSEAIQLINELIDRGEQEEDLTICFALAVACLETAEDKLNVQTQQRALGKLDELVKRAPPRNSQDAKALSAAGERVVDLLPYDSVEGADGEIVAACAETLARIGSPKARSQLLSGYVADKRQSVLRHVLECPGIHPFESPAITEDFAADKTVRLPRFAVPFLKDLGPVKQWSEVETVDLPGCSNLADIRGLESLHRLRSLNLQGCEGVRSLAGLRNLPELRVLNLRGCTAITDLAPLGALAKLQWLDLSYCPADLDVAPLEEELPSLRVLEWLDRPEAEILAPTEPPTAPQPGDVYYERLDGRRLKMVWIPAGAFLMGSPDSEEGRLDDEGPRHKVELDGIWIAAEPVTQAQYEAIVGTNPSHFKGPDRPVENVSWDDAMEFCKKLSERTKSQFTLPTEAQWEYACRAGGKTRYCFGDDEGKLGDYAWYWENSDKQTQPVGKKKPNEWGLYDMHGNVWELCIDWYGGDYYANSPEWNPTGPQTGKSRVVRGGSWGPDAQFCRSASRNFYTPDYRFSGIGFRLSRTP